MALVLVATAGAANANSYATVAEGDSYHESRLHSSVWTLATTTQKEAALVWATRLLDEGIDWFGIRTNGDSQALRFPRSGLVDKDGYIVDLDTIPQALKNATAELARLLIAADRTLDRETVGFKSISVGPISIDVDKLDEISVIPYSVWNMVSDYGVKLDDKNTKFSTARLVRT